MRTFSNEGAHFQFEIREGITSFAQSIRVISTPACPRVPLCCEDIMAYSASKIATCATATANTAVSVSVKSQATIGVPSDLLPRIL